MSWRFPTILFFLFTVGWLLYVAIAFLSAIGDDCSYIRTGACRAFMHYEPQLILWRGAAIQLAATLILVWFRKR